MKKILYFIPFFIVTFVFGLVVNAQDIMLGNPTSTENQNMTTGKNTTWDCVFFGSYPQAEVVATAEDATTVLAERQNGNDYIVDYDLYNTLEKATSWNDDGDITVNGEKFRRMRSSDAVMAEANWKGYYIWGSDGDTIDTTTYHYFKYEPIKWRVISVEDNKALLLSDVALDCQYYSGASWKVSRMREFLNSSFMETAFSDSEKTAIMCDTIEQTKDEKETIITEDNVFLI